MKLYGDLDPEQPKSRSVIRGEAITTLANAVYEFVREENPFELHRGMLCQVGQLQSPILEIDLSEDADGVFYVYRADAVPEALLERMETRLGITVESVRVLLRYAEQGRMNVPTTTRQETPTVPVDTVPTVEVVTVT